MFQLFFIRLTIRLAYLVSRFFKDDSFEFHSECVSLYVRMLPNEILFMSCKEDVIRYTRNKHDIKMRYRNQYFNNLLIEKTFEIREKFYTEILGEEVSKVVMKYHEDGKIEESIDCILIFPMHKEDVDFIIDMYNKSLVYNATK